MVLVEQKNLSYILEPFVQAYIGLTPGLTRVLDKAGDATGELGDRRRMSDRENDMLPNVLPSRARRTPTEFLHSVKPEG